MLDYWILCSLPSKFVMSLLNNLSKSFLHKMFIFFLPQKMDKKELREKVIGWLIETKINFTKKSQVNITY